MRTDKDLGKLEREEADSEDESQEMGLQWLLEMDLSEPEEKLFTVTGTEYQDKGLSAYEAEVAARPLVRGNARSDDLASYVDEEIVISSEISQNDIYSRTASQPEIAQEMEPPRQPEIMAIDFSVGRDADAGNGNGSVDEGADILGLAADDDIGEKFMSIKRIKTTVVAEPQGTTTVRLKGAPVPRQIANPDVDAGANEGALNTVAEMQGPPKPTSFTDYVASLPQNADDEAFDNYLLGGEHLGQHEADPEELTVAATEGSLSVDPSSEISIDYHEDFSAMAGISQDVVEEITAIIAPVMEEVSQRVRVRAVELGMVEDAVTVAVMFAADEASIKQCYAQGYEPISSVCHEVPEPLQCMVHAQSESIYLRLQSAADGASWNDLFSADFMSAGAANDAILDECEHKLESMLELPESVPEQDSIDALLDEGFGEDIFGDDFTSGFDTDYTFGEAAGAVDIEAAFSDLDSEELEAELEPVAADTVQEIPAEDDDSVAIADEIAAVGMADVEAEFEVDAQILAAVAAGSEVDAEPESAIEVAVDLAAELESDAAAEDDAAAAMVLPDGPGMGWCIPESIKFNYASQSNGEIFADFLDAFIEEGSAEIEKLENAVGEWEKDVTAVAVLGEVSRILHTIKGIAKGVGLQRFGTLVHNFETLLEALPGPAEGKEPEYFRIINAWLDAVVRGIEHVTDKRGDIASELPARASAAASQVTEAAGGGAVGEGESPTEALQHSAMEENQPAVLSALEKKRDQQLADEGAKVLAAQQSVRITSEKLDHLLNLTSQAQQLGVRASQNTTRSKRSSAELQGRLTSVRTHIGRIADRALLSVNAKGGGLTSELDALEMDQYSELQEAASILREGVEDLADLVDVVSRQNAQIEALLKQQSTVISSISSSIQGARVVPVSRLMPGLRRIVRTVSTDLDKPVSFKVLNETGALDRDHYARLQVVLEHMVRNALDHGIESADERLAAGKPTAGRITIDVRKAGGDYLIRLSDDGRGIDADAIRESAYKKGLDVDVDSLSDEEAIRLIFHKGFSTASTVSEISGRGVGMDIVLTELHQIGGDIQIQSAVGLGTSFEVRIPSNVSVNGALLVAAADESYAIPLNGLIAVEQVPVADFFAAVDQGEKLRLFDTDCEPAYLGTLCQGVGLPDRSFWGPSVPVIIAGTEERHMAIAIDNFEQALELVVRSLGAQFTTVPGLAGAATTADGDAIVALDLNLLVNSVGAQALTTVAVSQPKDTRMLALVVDDSRTQRMVATSQLDTVGVETVTAENGLVAIDLLNAAHRLPDVVLLDVEMPVKDGIETLREIRKSRRYGHLPVIMVTSRTGSKHRALAKEAGCNAYMGKPFNFPALIEQINELTGHNLQLS